MTFTLSLKIHELKGVQVKSGPIGRTAKRSLVSLRYKAKISGLIAGMGNVLVTPNHAGLVSYG